MSEKFSFRCNNCGHLQKMASCGEILDDDGEVIGYENDFPHACQVCGKGVTHSSLHHEIDQAIANNDADGLEKLAQKMRNKEVDPNDQTKTVYPDNWEVLSEAPAARLKQLGLDAKQVEAIPKKAMSPEAREKRVVGKPFRVFRVLAEEGVSGKEGSKAKKN